VNNTPVSIVSIDQRGGDTGCCGSGGGGLRRDERLITTTTATHTATSTKIKISSAFTSNTLSVCVRDEVSSPHANEMVEMEEDGGECQRGGARPRAGAGVEECHDCELCGASVAKPGRAMAAV
jgi:hypothetical protein